MENDGYDHQIGLFVPYDSPFKGAYVPKGAQALVKAVADDLGIWAYEITALIDFYELIFGIDMPIVDIISQLESESASQMLVNHISEDNTHSNFQSFLSNLGYPEKCRNVAIVNGSNNVTYQSVATPGDSLIYYNVWLGLNRYKIDAWYENAGETNQLLAKYFHFDPLPFGIDYDVLKRDINQMQFCNAPGSYVSADINLLGVDTKFTFVPSLSAIDISPSIYNIGNFAYNISNKNNVINNGLSPFDDYYSDTDNDFHTDYFNTRPLLEQEVMYKNMHMQNRSIDKDRDFEAAEKIEIGNYVKPYDWDKHHSSGDVEITSNSNVTFTAGESIKLKSGFKLNNGSNLKIKVETNPTQKSSTIPIPFTPKIVGPKYASSNSIYKVGNYVSPQAFNWRIKGETTDIKINSENLVIPCNLHEGMYTIFCSTTLYNISITSSKSIIIKQSNRSKEKIQLLNSQINPISIYPNPVSQNLIVKQKVESEKKLFICIRNSMGQEVFNSDISNNLNNYDISFLKNGLYLVEIKTINQIIQTEKILKK